MSDEKQQKRIQALENGIPFVQRSGIKVLALERGYCKLMMPFEPNVNHVGMMYAGALFTLAEIPGGAIFVSTFDNAKFFPIVRNLEIKFVKPAITDVTVEVRLSDQDAAEIAARAEADGKANYEWDCELKNASGEIVAVATCKYQMRVFPKS